MSEIQAVLFDTEYWTPSSARKWLKSHDIKPMKKVHTTENYHRYRIHDPDKYDHLRIKTLKPNIKIILGYI